MEAILFIGIQATGKSSFFRERFFESHVRLSLDMLRTRHREQLLFTACIEAKANFVIDNTNVSRAERQRFIAPLKGAGYRIVGFYFRSAIEQALERNAARFGRARVPDRGIRGTYARLELPSLDEGFNELFYVSLSSPSGFTVEEWNDEI